VAAPVRHERAVNINLTIVGILDMPLFVVTVIYGLIWRRANWQGAVAGFVCGGLAGVACYKLLRLDAGTARKVAPMVSAAAALIVTPIVSLITPHRVRAESDPIWAAFRVCDDDTFHLIPTSAIGRIAVVVLLLGFATFLAGVISASVAFGYAGMLAVGGMIAVFVGGVVRVYVE
jgi:SSS family solute:Na+ symporter